LTHDKAAFHLLAKGLRRLRKVGRFVADHEPAPDGDTDAARARLLSRVGYREPRSWQDLDAPAARDAAWWLLHRDLAYDYAFGDPLRAGELADALVAWCGPGEWRTNGDVLQSRVAEQLHGAKRRGSGWEPLSAATFDSGVLFVGAKVVAIVWVEDED
jgi:hypothetical protein